MASIPKLEGYPKNFTLNDGAEIELRPLNSGNHPGLLDLYRVSIELVPEREDAALEVVQGLGFKQVATLPGRIRDYFGSYKELVVLEVSLSDRSTWWKE